MVNEQKVDKRILRTLSNIKIAFVKLLSSYKIDDITVMQLTEFASINRKTFYLHYKKVSEILNDIENELVSKLTNILKSYDYHSDNLTETIHEILKLIVDNEYISYLLTSTIYRDEISNLISKTCVDNFKKKLPSEAFNPNIIDYFTAGTLKLLNNYLINKKTDNLIEIAIIAKKIIIGGYKEAL